MNRPPYIWILRSARRLKPYLIKHPYLWKVAQRMKRLVMN
jgi:hypothetical protein